MDGAATCTTHYNLNRVLISSLDLHVLVTQILQHKDNKQIAWQ